MTYRQWNTIANTLYKIRHQYEGDEQFRRFLSYSTFEKMKTQLSKDDLQYLNDDETAESTVSMDNVEKIVNKLATTKYDLDRRYITEVCVEKEDSIRSDILDYLHNVALDHKGKIFIVSEHKDHVHIVHDCKYHNGQCKCKFRGYGPVSTRLRKRVGHRKHISELTMRDWQNVFKMHNGYGFILLSTNNGQYDQ